ncbi:MAG TPA: hypothetical protein VIH18_27065 [Candidatus Binatia bacterium]|jgi:hypothetical protein
MPLRVPNLDDRTYDDLVEEALAMLPRYAPAWTNHNPSDPGITLIELLAYFTEIFIYRLNRVTKETKIRFLQLLYGAEADAKARFAQASSTEVDEALRQAVLALRRPQRAVTREDYEYLAWEATAHKPDMEKVLRARSFVRRNLETSDEAGRDSDAPGHVSVVILPARELEQDRLNALLAEVRNYLEPKRVLTTRLHATQPFFLWVTIGANIHLKQEAPEHVRAQARDRAVEKLRQYFDPWLGGGPQRDGWPFGRALYLSEVYEVLEQVEGVDYVDDVHVVSMSPGARPADDRANIGIQTGRSKLGVDSRLGTALLPGAHRFVRDDAGKLVAIALKPYELIRIASLVDGLSSGASSGADASATDQSTEVPT